MTRESIQQTLTKALSDLCILENIAVVYPNQAYEVTVGTPYLQQWFIEGDSTDTVLEEGYERIRGIMQIDINIPADTGESQIFSIYDKLKLIF